jgi:polynucleotide 5'-hydroxyl-kinase GRC3/NOL9
MEIIPERGWESLRRELLARRGVTILIGATDSGKSTLARFLLRGLLVEGVQVSVVDSDVGQSSLGLPGTISMRVFGSEREGENFIFEKMFFVGTVNPAWRLPLVLYGTRKLTGICKKKSDLALIDTCGLVGGEVGKALKVRKIRTVNPDRVFALQRGDELEHILGEIKDVPLWRVKVSSMARVRSRRERMRYRRERLSGYFGRVKMRSHVFDAEGLIFSDGLVPFSPGERIFGPATIIGLNRREDTVALGVVDEFTSSHIAFRSPVGKIRRFDKIIFGDATLQCLSRRGA